jgi:DNA-binding transcriptional regulator LsrR (DeoR family)
MCTPSHPAVAVQTIAEEPLVPGRSHADGQVQHGPGRFSSQALFEAASMYYLGDATQAGVARALGTSRTTVSRLLSEARRRGIVRIEVAPPPADGDDPVARLLAQRLGIDAVHLAPSRHVEATGTSLSPALSAALVGVGLAPDDVLLVSCGRTVYEAAQGDLPALPRVRVVPMMGGREEPEAWCHNNETTRLVAARVGGHPSFLYAPVLPGLQLRERLIEDATTRQVLELWPRARCAVIGLGAPPRIRSSLPRFVPRDPGLLRRAVGDVCNHFYGLDGEPVPFPGCERLIAIAEQTLRALPTSIAVAAGAGKVRSIIGAARARYFTELVTDRSTAAALLVELDDMPPLRSGGGRPRAWPPTP